MKKYLQDAGYFYKKDYNDLNNKEFTLMTVNYQKSEASRLGKQVLDRTETYLLFLNSLDSVEFKKKLESVINNALSGGVNVSLENSIDVENEENGYIITMSFYIQG